MVAMNDVPAERGDPGVGDRPRQLIRLCRRVPGHGGQTRADAAQSAAHLEDARRGEPPHEPPHDVPAQPTLRSEGRGEIHRNAPARWVAAARAATRSRSGPTTATGWYRCLATLYAAAPR